MHLKTLRKLGFVLMAVAPLLACAEGGWRLTLGVSYRDFDNVDFKAFELRNYGKDDTAGGNQLGIQAYDNAVLTGLNGPGVYFVWMDHVRYTGASEEGSPSSAWGPVIGVEKSMKGLDSIQLDFVANLQYHRAMAERRDDGFAASLGRFTAYSNQHLVGVTGAGVVTIATPPAAQNNNVMNSAVQVTVENNFEMDLIVLDLGVKASLCTELPVKLYLAGGPTVALSSLETSQYQSADWRANLVRLTNDTGAYSYSRSDAQTRLILGLYGALGAEYQINERLGIAAEYRYDLTEDDPETSHAVIDLESGSGQVKLVYSF